MRVLYFGSYNKDHSRNKILIEGLKKNGVEVIELHDRSVIFLKYLKLFIEHIKYRNKYDFMLVGFPGFAIMPLAKLISTAPVVFDAFVSYYDAHVFDRKTCKEGSLKAKYYYFLDSMSCRLADIVLLETQSLIDYFVKTFRIDREKFCRVFIGANDQIFKPAGQIPANNVFKVLFWGYMTPQHGVEYMLRAAEILSGGNIEFLFVGGGPERSKMLKLKEELKLDNVKFLPPVSQAELVKLIHQADVCLGAFGDVPRLKTVVTNKVYEALACAKPIITGNDGAREILEDGKHCLFCRSGDPQDLAEKILSLKNDPELRKKIAGSGYELFAQKFSPKVLGADLVRILSKLGDKRS